MEITSSQFNNVFTPVNGTKQLVDDLKGIRNEYKALLNQYQKDPSTQNLDHLSAFMYHMRTFLEDNKGAIFSLSKQNGWIPFNKGTNGGDGYEGFYNVAMNCANTFLNPEEGHPAASLYLLAETFTQVTWLTSHIHNVMGSFHTA